MCSSDLFGISSRARILRVVIRKRRRTITRAVIWHGWVNVLVLGSTGTIVLLCKQTSGPPTHSIIYNRRPQSKLARILAKVIRAGCTRSRLYSTSNHSGHPYNFARSEVFDQQAIYLSSFTCQRPCGFNLLFKEFLEVGHEIFGRAALDELTDLLCQIYRFHLR